MRPSTASAITLSAHLILPFEPTEMEEIQRTWTPVFFLLALGMQKKYSGHPQVIDAQRGIQERADHMFEIEMWNTFPVWAPHVRGENED